MEEQNSGDDGNNELNSFLDNNNPAQITNIENLPVDYVFSGNETVENYVFADYFILNIDEANNSSCLSQEIVPELDAQQNQITSTATESSFDEPIDNSSAILCEIGEVAPTTINPTTTDKILTRKRKSQPSKWKRNVAKLNRQSGKPYTTKNGVNMPARCVKEIGCLNETTCPFQCMSKFDMKSRQEIHNSYWAIEDPEKRHFYTSNVKQVPPQRKRTKAEVSRKPYTLQYSFNYMQTDIRVCQQFFVNTLNISKGRVYYFFKESRKRPTVTPGPQKHGKHQKKVLDEQQKQDIRDHIKKFPAVESHYCRQNSKRLYLEQSLTLAMMYRLYSSETENPLKESAYRNIFNYEFNLGFFRPKKDCCDKCIENKKLKDPTEQQKNEYSVHLRKKEGAHNERTKDRDVMKKNMKLGVKQYGLAPYDLQNVYQLPVANAGNLFYLRKFSAYNLTIEFNKVIYNVHWDEFCCGRAGTHLANALVKGLKQIVEDNPDLVHLTLWSDSCVSQNRNSYTSAAIQYFLNSDHSGNLQLINHKYSESGHGEVQEVDTAHSVIENSLRHKFIYSTVSLVTELHKIPNGKLKFRFIKMESCDYFDYESLAQSSNYTVIPYTKVTHLTYKKDHTEISYKLEFSDELTTADIILKKCHVTPPTLNELEVFSTVTTAKINDLRKMYGIMPEIDRDYYETEFKNLIEKLSNKDASASDVSKNDNVELNKSGKSNKKTEKVVADVVIKRVKALKPKNAAKDLVPARSDRAILKNDKKSVEVFKPARKSGKKKLSDEKTIKTADARRTIKSKRNSNIANTTTVVSSFSKQNKNDEMQTKLCEPLIGEPSEEIIKTAMCVEPILKFDEKEATAYETGELSFLNPNDDPKAVEPKRRSVRIGRVNKKPSSVRPNQKRSTR